MRTAFLVDGGFFLQRYRTIKGDASPRSVARSLHAMCLEHLRKLNRKKHGLYRIFYYDCPPLTKKVHNPITQRAIDFNKTQTASWRRSFFDELRKLRKVALRLGYVDEANGQWVLREDILKKLARKEITVDDLTDKDVNYVARQKGVDMKIGLDIASLAYKNQVDQIVLISGDSDFVSAAKLARREGIDFVLDNMYHPIRADLHEHIDGLQTVINKVAPSTTTATATPSTIPSPPSTVTPPSTP